MSERNDKEHKLTAETHRHVWRTEVAISGPEYRQGKEAVCECGARAWVSSQVIVVDIPRGGDVSEVREYAEEVHAYLHAPPAPSSVLINADQTINGPRHDAYGSAADAFAKYAIGWSEIIGAPVTAQQVTMCMIWLKMMRERNKRAYDNRVDMAGYVGLLDQIEQASQ